MISVIIPTLFKVPRVFQTIIELSNCSEVGEIILIDNTTNTIPIQIPKLVHICQGENIYVNPAWNRGWGLAKYDKICFLNDDVWFDWNYLKLISEEITKDKLMLGMAPDNYKTPSEQFKISPIQKHPNTGRVHRPDGYGCCWFIHKDNYSIIPHELKLWCGDDWIFYQDRERNHIIEGIKCHGLISATANAKEYENEFTPIKDNDINVMMRLISEGKIVNYFLGSWWDPNIKG